MELPFKDAQSKVTLENGRVVMTSSSYKPFLNVTGLNQVAIVEVVKIGGDTGVIYRNAGNEAPSMDKAILLAQGDVAVIGSTGLLGEVNTADPIGRKVVGEIEQLWLALKSYRWLPPVLGIVFLIALVVFASRMRRRRAGDQNRF